MRHLASHNYESNCIINTTPEDYGARVVNVERRPDPIPAGTPKEKPPAGEPAKEAPPEAPKEK